MVVQTDTATRDAAYLSRPESQDIVIQRHLVAARTRLRARNKGQLSVGPQTEIPVPKDGGDLAEKLEAVPSYGSDHPFKIGGPL